MDQIYIIVLSLFAALGIAYLIIGLFERIVFDTDNGIKKVKIQIHIEQLTPITAHAIARLAERCQCANDQRLVVVDEGLSEEQVDMLYMQVPNVEIIKEEKDG